jgi:hypothetical protein
MTGNDLRYELFGKPYSSIYRFTEKLIEKANNGNLPSRIYAIGDNPLSDIKGIKLIVPIFYKLFYVDFFIIIISICYSIFMLYYVLYIGCLYYLVMRDFDLILRCE